MSLVKGWLAALLKSPSALVLVAANLLPVAGVLAWGWPVLPLMVLFWAENLIVGLVNLLRMLCAVPGNAGVWLQKLFWIPFFCVHYGMFTFVHGVFVFAMFADKDAAGETLNPFRQFDFELPLAAIAASHLVSFAWNYLWRGEFRRAEMRKLMIQPYARVIVLHLVILFGGFAAAALGSPLWALLLLIALKIGLDLYGHFREHRRIEA